MVARQFWELDAAGSSPVIPIKKELIPKVWVLFLFIEKDLNLKQAECV